MRAEELSQIYAGSYTRLVRQLYAVTQDVTEAQDCVQDAFVRALTRPGQLSAVDNPEAWLLTVALNRARTRWRRTRHLDRLLRRADRPVLPGDLGPEHVALVAALRQLPRVQREAVALHHLADLPVQEVALVTGVPTGTVKARLARGRRRLAELLHDESDDYEGSRNDV